MSISGIGISTEAQRYHIAKDVSSSFEHQRKSSNGRRKFEFLTMFKKVCRCTAGTSNGTTTAVFRYCFVDVIRALVVPHNRSVDLPLDSYAVLVQIWYRMLVFNIGERFEMFPKLGSTSALKSLAKWKLWSYIAIVTSNCDFSNLCFQDEASLIFSPLLIVCPDLVPVRYNDIVWQTLYCMMLCRCITDINEAMPEYCHCCLFRQGKMNIFEHVQKLIPSSIFPYFIIDVLTVVTINCRPNLCNIVALSY